MTEMIRAHFPNRRLVVADADTAGEAVTGPIVVSGLAVPWNVSARFNFWGDTLELAPGSIDTSGAASRIKFLLDHGRHAMGTAQALTSTDDGLDARMFSSVSTAMLPTFSGVSVVRSESNEVSGLVLRSPAQET